MTTPIYHVKGYGHQLDVYEDRAVITPTTGLISFMTRGFVGPKTIFFASIAAIEHKRMGLANGFLQFIIPGGLDRSPYHDPNTFMYGNAGADARVAEIKTYIEQRIRDIRNSQAATQHPP